MIEARDLKKSFGEHRVLNGVSFSVEKGESVVIIGASGGGKSVLLKHITGLLDSDGGKILYDGRTTGDMSPDEIEQHLSIDSFDTGIGSLLWCVDDGCEGLIAVDAGNHIKRFA